MKSEKKIMTQTANACLPQAGLFKETLIAHHSSLITYQSAIVNPQSAICKGGIMAEQNYYKLLGVNTTASSKEIQRAYRQKAIKCHPDKNPNQKALEEFRQITEAYNILINPKSRAKYDRMLISKQEKFRTPRNKQRNIRKGKFFEIKEILSTIFTKRPIIRSRIRRSTKRFDIRRKITITLNEAALGCEKIIKVDYEDIYEGHNGYNIIDRTKEIRFKIFPGIKDGTCLKFRRQGGAGINGGSRGDLYVTVRVQPDKFLTRKDDDIHCELKVDFVKALLGTKLKVPTVEGKVDITIPSCTQPGQIICIKGKGFPKTEGEERGDQFIKVKVVFPDQISARQRELIEQFYKN